jgi:hypothetical protein
LESKGLEQQQRNNLQAQHLASNRFDEDRCARLSDKCAAEELSESTVGMLKRHRALETRRPDCIAASKTAT